MANKYDELIKALQEAEGDVVKGYGGNKAASTRARKGLMAVRDLAQEVRKELLAAGKGDAAPTGVNAFFSESE